MDDKEKFLHKLRGEPVGKDALENELFVGDTILYAATIGQSAKLKAGRITKVSDVRGRTRIQVRTITKGFSSETSKVAWHVGGYGTLSKCHNNAVLWKDPPQDIIDKLNAVERKGKSSDAD